MTFFDWSLFIDLGLISAALLAATALRARVRFFQTYLIPNAIPAGFMLLPLYNFVLPHLGVGTQNLEALVYHLLSISFLAMALRGTAGPRRNSEGKSEVFATSIAVLSQYAVQATIGLVLTALLIFTVLPELFHSFGLLMPLGFALGPGQALSIGEGWRTAGIEGAGSIGLTFAAIGFLVSCFGGVFLINYGIRHGWMKEENVRRLRARGTRTGIYARGHKPVGSHLTTESEAIDSMTFNLAITLVCYLATYLLLTGLHHSLSTLGPPGQELAVNLWGISFIFAAMLGLGAKRMIHRAGLDYLLDDKSLTRIAGLSVDLLVAGALGAISLVVVQQYWAPILVVAAVAAVAVGLSVPWICSRLFRDHAFERMLLVFGVSTGTLTTGLALLRVVDPDFETPVGTDYAYAAGITFVLAIPFILSLNMPTTTYQTGNMLWFWLTLGVALAYLTFSLIMYVVIGKRRAFKRAHRVWLPSETYSSRSA